MNISKSITRNFTRLVQASAVFLLTLAPAFALSNAPHASTPANESKSALEPAAVLKKKWVDYNVTEEGKRGMRIHVDFEVSGLKDVDAELIARVRDEKEEFLLSKTAFANEEGELETGYSIKPGFQTTEYEDAQMFLPYSEFDLRKGVWNLKLDIDLKYEAGGLIQHLSYHNFVFTAPNSAAGAAEEAGDEGISAKVNRIWVDYDVLQNRKKGMRLHINFEVTGLMEVNSKLTVRVRREDDSFLTSDSSYSNEDGQLELAFKMKPGLRTTVYKDAVIFLPYSEINISRGVWNLKFDIDLNYDNGEIIDHLAYHEFKFKK